MSAPDADLALLSTFIPFGPTRISVLVKYFGSAKKVWFASRNSLMETGLSRSLVLAFEEHRTKITPSTFLAKLAALEVTFTTNGADDYPANLTGLVGAPTTLFVRGKMLSDDHTAVAIVGTRKITNYGKEVTQRFATRLAEYGVTIISGLAFGVDRYAHESALAAGGRCIAVLASGIDQITPVSNKWLGEQIIERGGAVISEFPPGTVLQKSYFPHRNRIISGLSRAVVVVEGAEKSGTLHTAKHAADQGKEVFAVPGQITSPLSAAPHMLIQNGAKIAFGPEDVLTELDMQLKVDKSSITKVLPSTSEEVAIAEQIANEPLHLDELARILKMPVAKVSQTLTMMELKGSVRHLGSGTYKKA